MKKIHITTIILFLLLNIFCSSRKEYIKKNTSEIIEIETGVHENGIKYLEVLKEQDKIITFGSDSILTIRKLNGEFLKSIYVRKRKDSRDDFVIKKILFNELYNTVFLFGDFGRDENNYQDKILVFDAKNGEFVCKWNSKRYIWDPIFKENGKKLFLKSTPKVGRDEDGEYSGTIELLIKSRNELVKVNFIEIPFTFSENENYFASTIASLKNSMDKNGNFIDGSLIDSETSGLMNEAEKLANQAGGGFYMYKSDSKNPNSRGNAFKGENYGVDMDSDFLYLIHEKMIYTVDSKYGQVYGTSNMSNLSKSDKYGTLRIKHSIGKIKNAFLNKNNNGLTILSESNNFYSYNLNEYLQKKELFQPNIETKKFTDPETGQTLIGKYYKDNVIEATGNILYKNQSETINGNFIIKDNFLYFLTYSLSEKKSSIKIQNIQKNESIRSFPLSKKAAFFKEENNDFVIANEDGSISIFDKKQKELVIQGSSIDYEKVFYDWEKKEFFFKPRNKANIFKFSISDRQIKLIDGQEESFLNNKLQKVEIECKEYYSGRWCEFDSNHDIYEKIHISSTGIVKLGGRPVKGGGFEAVLTVFITKDHEWVVFDYYNILTASQGGNRLCYWRLDGESNSWVDRVYSFEQLDLQFNQPDYILAKLYEEDSIPEVNKERVIRYKTFREFRIKQNGFNVGNYSNLTGNHAPKVSFLRKASDLVTRDRNLPITFSIKDDKILFPIIGYKIFVNGVPIYGDYIKRTTPDGKPINSKEVTIEDNVILSQGDNKIEVSGFTEDGVESPRESFTIKYEPPSPRKPDLYYIGIGVNSYDANETGGLDALTYAVKDSKELKDTFEKSGKGKFANVYTKVLNDGEVTRENISKLKDFLKNSQVDDQVIVFLSGHGIRKDTKVSDLIKAFGDTVPPQYKLRDGGDVDDVYYYMTANATVDKPWENAIPLDGIRELVNGIPSRQKILLVDTCQSGEKLDLDDATVASLTKNIEIRKTRGQTAKTRGLNMVVKPGSNEKKEDTEKKIIQTIAKSNAMKEMSELFPELRRGTGTIEISAATGAQSALESKEWQNGAFTFVIKEAILKGKAKDEKGNITARSLRKYVLEEVEKLTDGQQTSMVARNPPFHLKDETWQTSDLTPDGLRSSSVGIL